MRLHRSLILLALAAALTAGCTSPGKPAVHHSASRTSARSVGGAAAGGTCSSAPPITPLPTWARAGFHPPDVAMPHVLGARGDIVAILWARTDALHAPPLANRNNKILWVSRLRHVPLSPLKIRATLAGPGTTVYREIVGGPGPSYVNLPAAGCWTLDLSWSGYKDELKLRYVAS